VVFQGCKVGVGEVNTRNDANILALFGLSSQGVLKKIKNTSFRFVWSGNREKEGIPLVKW